MQLPPPSWDPYATPGAQPPALFPQDYYFPGSAYQTTETLRRFLEEIRAEYTWIPASGGQRKFGVDDVELSATFTIPFLYSTQHPLLITPGFASHFWSGPISEGPQPADMPPNAFSAYLDAAWNPQVTPWLGAELGFRTGVYSDYRKVTTDSLRFMGHGLAVLSLTPSVQVKAGAVYLDRNRVKILPAGGLVWMPNPDVRFDILFPNPMASRRLMDLGDTQLWAYVRGEYGGGNWAVQRVDGTFERVDYNDLRVMAGIDFDRAAGLSGLFEVGVAFDREIVYRSPTPTFRPEPAVVLRAGLVY